MRRHIFKKTAFSLVLATALAAAPVMSFAKELPKTETVEIKPDMTLDEYLKQIKYSKEDVLSSKGDLVDESKIKAYDLSDPNSSKIIITHREKMTEDNPYKDISMISGKMSGVYPGALFFANSNLIDGTPDPFNDLKKAPVTFSLDLNGNTLGDITVDNPTKGNVTKAINEALEKWYKTGNKAAAKINYKKVMAYSSQQLDVALGIKGAAGLYGVDLKASASGEKSTMLVVFNQIYYSIDIEPGTASKIFDKCVTAQDLARYINTENPAAVQVTHVDYGRSIIVKLETSKSSAEAELAWNAAIKGVKIDNSEKYKEVMDNTTYTVFEYGGSADTAKQLIQTTDVSKVNEILGTDMEFTKDTPSVAISFACNFIDNAKPATIIKATEYVKTTYTVRNEIKVTIDTASAYCYKHQKFYARPITGIDEKTGELKYGKWECLIDTSSGGDQYRVLPAKYVDFGYTFDITWGTDFPFSGQFWDHTQGTAHDIYIDMSGTCRNAKITIKVNDQVIFKDGNCSKHKEWKPV